MSELHQELPWRDAVVVVGITVLTVVVAAHFQVNEALYALTRHWEYLQLDELPIGFLVMSVCLIWLAWRRYRHASRELHARRIAEARLASVLAENRGLGQENLRIHESERKHLARELHDELGQYLNAIKLDAVSITGSGGRDPEFSVNASLAIIRAVDHVHGAVGDMIARLRPVGLDELGLVAAIEHCVNQWRQRLPDSSFALAVHGDFESLSEPLNLTLYRLIQEGLTNVYKHAGAQRVEITLERMKLSGASPDELWLTVTDDGRGMETGAHTSRFGLSGMRERVEMAGGSFVLKSAPGRGLSFAARIPVSQEYS
jgi:two-component system, NarL family, sensor histidine kinase UhpB